MKYKTTRKEWQKEEIYLSVARQKLAKLETHSTRSATKVASRKAQLGLS